MLNDGTAEDAGIIAPTEESTQDRVDNSEVNNTSGKKWIPKVIAQRNELREENAGLKAQIEALAAQTVNEKFAERDRQSEKEAFQQEHGAEALQDVEAVLKKYPDLNYVDAHAIAKKNQTSFSMDGEVPKSVTNPESKPLTVEQAEADLRRQFAEGKLTV